jgi:superfamily II DNA/RNA helicase
MSFNPIETSNLISERYKRYLKTTFAIRDADFAKDFAAGINDNKRLFKGLYLDAMPPYKPGKSIKELVEANTLSQSFAPSDTGICVEEPEGDALLYSRPLYSHQEEALTRAIAGKNLIVSTGTGSGKTESFLLPILEHLLWEKENGTLSQKGVRALLLYPMNALANDQMKRLRFLLKRTTDITFGRYIGDTQETERMANEAYLAQFNTKPASNEMLSREKMQENPPHILLTNYAMLEYLLLRPDDSAFFDGETAKHWKFIVMDEVHTYDGAKGIETAMLLKRLKERIVRSHAETLFQFIGTSATLGGSNSMDEAKKFASTLFSEPLETWELVSSQTIVQDQHECPSTFPKEQHERLQALRQELNSGIKTVAELAKIVFPNSTDSEGDCVRLVTEAADSEKHKYRDGTPLLRARYHFFVKALEGGYISFLPEKKFHFKRRRTLDDGTPVFEAAICTNCGSLYVVGKIEDDKFVQTQKVNDDNKDGAEFFLVEEADVAQKDFSELTTESKTLNVQDGTVSDKSNMVPPNCIRIHKVKTNEHNWVKKCPVCEQHQSVSRFLLGKDAPASVLATSLYEKIMPIENTQPAQSSSGWGNVSAKSSTKKTIAFSDSRQDAAFFAPFMENSFSRIVRRRIILDVIKDNLDDILTNSWGLEVFANRVSELSKQKEILVDDDGNLIQSTETQRYIDTAWKWLIAETLGVDGENSLERLAMVKFVVSEKKFNEHFNKPDFYLPPKLSCLRGDYHLTDEDIRQLLQFFFDVFRNDAAITLPPQVPNLDDANVFRFIQRTTQYERLNDGQKTLSLNWLPKKRENSNSYYPNRRTHFLKVLLKSKTGNEPANQTIDDILGAFWDSFQDNQSPFSSLFSNNNGKLQLKYDYLKIIPLVKGDKYYQCSTSKIITHRNVAGVSPVFRYNSKLQERIFEEEQGEQKDVLLENHYRKIYQELEPERLVSKEHSAQLKSDVAAKVQQEFIEGKINILSCSTTFELGVDVGSLETVFLKNVPPNPANYIQRAGRAGRRTSSAAYALTFCQRRPHDLRYFEEPEAMIKGIVPVPKVEVQNEKIVRRHIHSVAFAAFWKKYPDYFGKMKDFFLKGDTGSAFEAAMAKMRQNPAAFEMETFMKDFIKNEFQSKHPIFSFLNNKPDEIKSAAFKIVPDSMREELIGSDGWAWLSDLIGKDDDGQNNMGILTKEAALLFYDTIAALDRRRQELRNENKDKAAAAFGDSINTFQQRQFIAEAARFGVLPKYGFPVDVVSLETSGSDNASKDLDLSRDLKIALSEFAPESKLVARKKIWTSWGLKVVSGRRLVHMKFKICENCKRYHSTNADTASLNWQNDPCESCRSTNFTKQGQFIHPEFGFVAESKSDSFNGVRPEKTYTSRVHFSQQGKPLPDKVQIESSGGILITAQGSSDAKLGVINQALFYVCESCGYAEVINSKNKTPKPTHKNHRGGDCRSTLKRTYLGYEFKTDVAKIEIVNFPFPTDFKEKYSYHLSLLYAMIDGAAESLGITRTDIDGCLYPEPSKMSYIIYDTVPGGAGHSKRLCEKEALKKMLECAYERITKCKCGGESGDASCYACLQNYQNQFDHDDLKRRYPIDFLKRFLQ